MEEKSMKKTYTTRNNDKHSMEKPNGLHEAAAVSKKSPRNSYDIEVHPISFHGCSVLWDSDSDLGSKSREKKAYPLPQPSASSCRASMESHQRGSSFGSERVSVSSFTSNESSSSDDDDIHGDFSSFRVYEENNSNLWSKGSNSGSKASYMHQSPRYLSPWDATLESPTEKHPCHRLPLPPPTSPNKPPKKSPSKWKKGKLLGRGTFGHVFAGFNSENGTMCAVKEVKVIKDDQTSKECLKQLNQEISLLSELSHPNIVQYYGSEMGSDKLSVYLEYASGGSVHKLLGEYGPFKEPVIRSYTRQILSGLAYLHARNTVHRDIKGANILVDPNGEIKLADFGMAKHMTSCSSMLSFKGSPYWMAPEVIMNAHGYSLAVDIWSLGCTVLEMATSKPPWSQYEGVAAIFKIANSKGFPDIPNNLSKDAQNFIKLCLQREPTARPTALKLLQHPFVQDQSMVEPTKFNLVDDRRRPSKGSWDEISLASSLPESPCSNSTQQCKSACGSSHRSSYQTSY
ncbi:hypothetical protein ERO13_D02G074000v2 [Gossypium hirsutum]|uniref:mitogen-activated protein kinase kinase kinase n=3 Tax=Gossypium TaxID=3633 RepID=A0A1U8JTY6_GOSHI|nr:mitogen-activated protein kinase kinase kinase 3-like isoform X1 [Gossypium hirsutum]KAB2040465.1 hypothetical protein ES319_D02G085400v1 [Gossypium barbadense]KAG4157618.1 hypothetical protein ERO13_D02G074000v2 [Gossypium hirsutum]